MTLLFTDIEGSTAQLADLGSERWEEVLQLHAVIVRGALAAHEGIEVRTEGDAFFAVFTSARSAISAAAAAQRGLHGATWPHGVALRVRMGVHTGEARPAVTTAGTDYIGLEVHRAARIAAAGHGGQVLVSDTTRALVHDRLPDGIRLRDLGEHRFKDLERPQRMCQLIIDGVPDEFPPLRTLDAVPNNLPTQATSFIGREQEIAKAVSLLEVHRLVMLTGSGGTGKTRLALQVTATVLDRFSGGAWLVELGTVTDPAAVPAAVAARLHLSVRAGQDALTALAEALRGEELLLVLDNCEHLIEPCATLVAELLRTCPRIKVIATSREALNVPGEVVTPVPSLALPQPGALPPLDELRGFEAVRLFLDRAAFFQPGFDLSDENAEDIVRICRRLDGIPLALELAAARVRALSTQDLAQRLDDRFRLLTGGGRTVVARQQTLRALIDWSYGLLSPGERTLLARLSVFARDWTLGAAEAVCDGDGLERGDVLDHLAHLVDKSLVTKLERAGARYSMLETVREYARDKLIESGEAHRVRARHFEHFLRRLKDARALLAGTSITARLSDDYQNLLAALDWIESEPANDQRLLEFAGSMLDVAMERGAGGKLRQVLTRALERSDPTALTAARARALLSAAQLAGMQDDLVSAAAYGREAADILRALGNKRDLAQVLIVSGAVHGHPESFAEAESLLIETGDLWGLGLLRFITGDVALERGDYEDAQRRHTESLEIFRRVPTDSPLNSAPLLSLARIACVDGDFGKAHALLDEALAIRRRMPDNVWAIAITLNSIGEVDRCMGDATRAAPRFAEALRYGRELDDSALIAWSLHDLAHVSLCQHDLAPAATRFRESLMLRRRGGSPSNLGSSLSGVAGLALRAGALLDAAWLFGAAAAVLDRASAVLSPADDQVRRSDLADLERRLDGTELDVARAGGRSADLDEIDARAEQVLRAVPSQVRLTNSAPRPSTVPT